MLPTADDALARGSFAAALARHLRWQRGVLRSLSREPRAGGGGAPPSSRGARFLVLRPGDQLTVCEAAGMGDVRAHCHRAA